MLRNLYVFFVVLLGVFLFSCSVSDSNSEIDTELPKGSILKPTQGDTLYRGDSLRVRFEASDNLALKNYKLNLHHNFDGHAHGRLQQDPVNPFTYDKVFPLNNAKDTLVDATFGHIPAGVDQGAYHIMLYLMDAEGNTDFWHYDVYIH